MQQRQPRLGDIVDDYCPRERRITNHAVVAMVGDTVKQTRCTTCDADHEYKHAKVPPQRRKKEEGGVLYNQVLAGMPRKAPAVSVTSSGPDLSDTAETPEPALPVEIVAEPELQAAPDGDPSPLGDESVHRPLIRATLPRLSDEPPQRREPEFTMRTPQHTRPGRFGKGGFRGPRPGGGQGFGANGNGDRPPGPRRHGQGERPGNFQGGGRSGQGQGGPGNRSGRPGGQGHRHGPNRGGKKSPR